jgi:hypothetical protein
MTLLYDPFGGNRKNEDAGEPCRVSGRVEAAENSVAQPALCGVSGDGVDRDHVVTPAPLQGPTRRRPVAPLRSLQRAGQGEAASSEGIFNGDAAHFGDHGNERRPLLPGSLSISWSLVIRRNGICTR